MPLFADLDDAELAEIGRLFKVRRFAAGETVIQEGSGGAAFFVIESGEAMVTVGGEERATLAPGDHFGEIALIDEGARTATVAATSRARLLRADLLGFPPARRAQRRNRLEAAPGPGTNVPQRTRRVDRAQAPPAADGETRAPVDYWRRCELTI